ncbi:MAG: NTP transferase domain-containing protein, partial [Bacteroidota bacterium]
GPSTDVPLIADRFLGLGPLGAICSAFMTDPNSAWLVLACDLPLLEKATVADLLAARDASRFATAIKGAAKPFPEPLVALYEPRCYARLLSFLSLGYACPRKVLINSDVALRELSDEEPLTNANTPEERKRILAALPKP